MARHSIGIFILVVTLVAVLVLYKTLPTPQNTATFAGVSLTFDYATTPAEHERGLGGRTDVPEGYGMLSIFPMSEYHGFWMKDTQVPLDIFWLDEHGKVVFIEESVATSTYPHVFYPAASAKYVLETAAGFAARHGVASGTPLVVRGGLQNLPSASL